MMHPDFFSFLNLSGGTKTIVSTNGHFLTEENSEKLATIRSLTSLLFHSTGWIRRLIRNTGKTEISER